MAVPSRHLPAAAVGEADWRDAAACRETDPELFFPRGHEGPWVLVIEQAKAVCRSCPVFDQCRQWVMETREPFGVWAGMSEVERRSYFRRRGYQLKNLDSDFVEGDVAPARTLQSLWAERTLAGGGHMAWTGSVPVSFEGRAYTPHRIGFELDRGRPPVGLVRAACGVGGCVLPAHLMDQVERSQRDLCGTRSGYVRHRRNGEDACGACRRANTDADNRLRRTGTTRVLAS